MDIAALSMTLSQSSVRQDASLSLMKRTMDQAESNGHSVVKMLQESSVRVMEQSVLPHVGSSIDLRM